MAYMESYFTTVSTKGQLVIPSEMRNTLGIQPGTRIALILEGKHIVLQPVTERLIEETRGMLAGKGPSMTDELQKERRAEKW